MTQQWLPIIVRKKCMAGVLGDAIPEAQKQIQALGYELSAQEVKEQGARDTEESFARGVCILDEGHPLEKMSRPKEYERPKIPVCLKRAWEALYLPYRTKENLAQIMRISRGEHLPKEKYGLAEWQAMQREAHALPVVVRLCAEEGCSEEIVVTVGATAAAVERYNLLEDPTKFYEPSVFCKKHRRERDVARAKGAEREVRGEESLRTLSPPVPTVTFSEDQLSELAARLVPSMLSRLSSAAPSARVRQWFETAGDECEEALSSQEGDSTDPQQEEK